MIHTPCREPDGAFAGVSTPVGRPGRDRTGHSAATTSRPPARGLHGSSLTILSPAASTRSSATLVELERQLEALLLEYEAARGAWPNEPRIFNWAKIGRQVEDALGRIYELHRAITQAQAEPLPDAAVQLRRLAALLDGQDAPSPACRPATAPWRSTAPFPRRTPGAGLLNVRLWLLADISKDRELGPLYPRKRTFARQSKKVC